MGISKRMLSVVAVSFVLLGCGDDQREPMGSSSDATTGGTEGGTSSQQTGGATEDSTGPGPTGGTTDDPSAGSTGGGEVCGTVPSRFIVFGDSIFQCFGQSAEKQDPGCSAFIVHEYLDQDVAPGITYENLAVGGAVTRDVPQSQMPGTNVGVSGHAVVLIMVGGNDLSPSLLANDAEAEATYDAQIGGIEESWMQMLAFLDDPANFPDGVTLIVDNQYDPFDECTADPYAFMSPTKIALLADFNERFETRLSGRPDSHVVDIHEAFLGHGHHYQNAECPHSMDGAQYWMLGGNDLIHPNTEGHAGIADEVIATLQGIYACE